MSAAADDHDTTLPNCARCPYVRTERRCRDPQGKAPPGCPTVEAGQLLAECQEAYQQPQLREFARQASIQEAAGYAGRDRGFELVSVACKVGALPKELLGLGEAEKIVPGSFEPLCNPVLQALVCNARRCELNILLGLCVGHDSLFLQRAEAPCTVLAVKDRVLGHNPLAAVYQLDSYYRSLKG